MSAIAGVLRDLGHVVSGSDLVLSSMSQSLESLGVKVFVGHRPENIADADFVIASSAIGKDNPEIVAAVDRAKPVINRASILEYITKLRSTICVAGTHGKTTTSSILALALEASGMNPSFIIGGYTDQFGSNYRWTNGQWLVVEADESDGTFLSLDRCLAIITNLEADHLDFFGSIEALQHSFVEFITNTRGPIIYCADDENLRTLIARQPSTVQAISYGTAPTSDFQAYDIRSTRDSVSFCIRDPSSDKYELVLSVPGKHVAMNATAAFGAATVLGGDPARIIGALSDFTGAKRRYEYKGQYNGVTFIDDYAHYPTEIRSTLETVGYGKWAKVHCVFQPHRFSRISQVKDELVDCFVNIDELYITEIYSAGEPPLPGVSAERLARQIESANSNFVTHYCPDQTKLFALLRSNMKPNELCIVLSAGDLVDIGRKVFTNQ